MAEPWVVLVKDPSDRAPILSRMSVALLVSMGAVEGCSPKESTGSEGDPEGTMATEIDAACGAQQQAIDTSCRS